jgi:hypothetical protein
MRFINPFPGASAPVLALSLLATLAGTAFLAGCNQNAPESDKDISQTAPDKPQELKAATMGEGHKLEGAALEAFLKRLGDQPKQPEQPVVQDPPALPKAAAVAGTSCLVDFNSVSALSAMPDHAYAYYATYPWYTQPCANGYTATVLPVNYGSYYLTSEVPTCASAPNGMGTPATYPCKNVKDAALYPRRAANATLTTADLGLNIQTYRYGVFKNFDLNSISVFEGPVSIYVFRADINGWWYWDLPAAYWTFPYNATNLKQMQVFGKNKYGMFSVDNIQLTGRP